jgi:hypothetical protein
VALNLTTDPLRGRQWILTELQDWFDNGGQRATLVGPPGIGKSRVGRAFVESNPGAVLIDFALARDPYESLNAVGLNGPEGKLPKLLVIDALESAPAALWRTYGLDQDFPGVPKLFIFRPGVHSEGLQRPGTQLFAIDPLDPKHEQDLNEHLLAHGLEALVGVVSTFQEAQFLISNRAQGALQLDSYYLALWRETTRAFQGPTRILVEQVALLLADTPEGLPFEAISDFTGLPLVSVREAVDMLAPILSMTPTGITLFSRGLALYIARHFSRDMGPVHGRIVSFFRETYPSWHEMHDPYGWRYLVLHCDRLARASRRQDFSVLHWLNEGSFSQLKLERTGMLPSVLKDLRLSLLASLETEDIPRIVAFGCRLARLRKHESVKTVHRLADSGNLALARENAFIVSGEGQKFLLWLLFATQTLESGDLFSTAALLKESLDFPTAPLEETEVKLAANLLAALLSYPGLSEDIETLVLTALSMDDSPLAGCLAYKTAGQSHLLKTETRLDLFRQAANFAARISDDGQRKALEREIASRMARLNPGDDVDSGVAYPDRLKNAKDRDKELAKMITEIRKGTTSVATAAAALVPIADDTWTNAAFYALLELVNVHKEEETLRHGLSGLMQSLEDSVLKEIEPRILDTLSLAILSFDKPVDRSRYLARFAVLLSVKGRPLEAQQRISLSAANAFSVADTATRADALLRLAGLVAATGAVGRARDLSFHAIELRSRVGELDRESRQLVRLLSTSTAKNDSAEEIVRLGESLRFDNSPMELEAKGRALVALAAGLARLGAEGQARTYREKAIDTTRAIENLELRIHLLCDLAGALHQSGEKRQARKLAKEARTLYDDNEEGRGLQSATGLLRVSMVLENRTQIKKCFELCLKHLKSTDLHTWLGSPALLDLLGLSRHLGKTEELLSYLASARQAEDLTDEQLLGLLRCELELGEYGRAEALLDRLSSLSAQCQGGIDLSLASLQSDPERALRHLARIPLEMARCEGIRRLALLNSAEIRPTEQFRVRHVLNKLTLMAIDHPDAMDSVLSRWIQGCPEREIILAVADKMSWSTGATGLFREALQTAHAAGGDIEAKPQAEEEPVPLEEEPVAIKNDDGFQVLSLTKPKG